MVLCVGSALYLRSGSLGWFGSLSEERFFKSVLLPLLHLRSGYFVLSRSALEQVSLLTISIGAVF